MEIDCGEKINDQNETAAQKVNLNIKNVINNSELKDKSDETMRSSTSGNESSFSLNLSEADADTTPPEFMNDCGTGSRGNSENNIRETIDSNGTKTIESGKSGENFPSRKLEDDEEEGPTESEDPSPDEVEYDDDSEEDEAEPDVALIIGSSDEEEEEEERDNDEDDAPNVEQKFLTYQELVISSDDEQDEYFDDYDADEDLMDSVVMSSRKFDNSSRKTGELQSKNEKETAKMRRPKNAFRKIPKIYDYRLQAKKKSVKRLTNRFAHQHQTSASLFSTKTGTSKSDEKTDDEKLLYPIEAYTSKMQQVDKIRDSIQSAEDLKQQYPKALNDDQNKENVENNEKLLSSSATIKLNGNAEEISKNDEEKNACTEQQKNEEKDSTETRTTATNESTSLEPIKATHIITNVTKMEVNDDIIEKKDDKFIEGCEIKKENSEKPIEESAAEAVPKNVSDNVSCNKTSLETKTNLKDIQQTDLKKLSSSSAKRLRSVCLDDTNLEDLHPTKKLRVELEANFQTHNRILNEYIEKTSNNSVEDIQKHINQLIIEIQTINEMMKAKEIEWNNMLHLKKVKEEICFRITRKKQVMEIMATKVGETNFPGGGCTDIDNPNETITQNSKPPKIYNSTPTVTSGGGGAGGVYSDNINISVLNSLSNANVTPIASNPQSNSNMGETAQSILQNRANMKSSDLAKEKATTQRLHRNILPKPSSSPGSLGFNSSAAAAASVAFSTTATPSVSTGLSNLPLTLSNALAGSSLSVQQPILNSYLSAASTVQQQLGEMLNGHHHSQIGQQNCNTNGGQTLMVGRQGVFKDVKSIIAEYKQRHPEVVPRRGRRVKSNPSATDSGSILGNALKSEGKMNTDLGLLLAKFDGNSRPSSNDSSHSMTNLIGTSSGTNLGNVSFKDVLVQFAKMSGQTERLGSSVPMKLQNTCTGNSSQGVPPPYPEVTLHPVSTTQSNTEPGTAPLLHGILTKFLRESATRTVTSTAPTSTTQTPTSQNYSSSFSPTLARLLTAPERITPVHGQPTINSYPSGLQSSHSAVAGSGLNLSKVVGHNSEITITPVSVTPSQTNSQSLMQHSNIKDEEADDSVDRLVIDEGGDSSGADGATRIGRIAPHAIGQVFGEHEVPACQGCKKQEAQFVCAGCGNQWYCSRECQVASWDEHSEVCTG